MAHTDACKIQVTQFVKKLTEKGMSVNAACKEAQQESDGIPAETIRRWWQEIKARTTEKLVNNDQDSPTPENILIIPNNQVEHGGKRDGAGAPQKYPKPPNPPKYEFTNAMQIATFVISHLERIMADDPERYDALAKVSTWIENNL